MIGRTFLGATLAQARSRARVSQKRLATEAGCHVSTVTRYETGGYPWIREATVRELVAAAARLNITIDGRPLSFDDVVRPDPSRCPVCAARELAQTEALSA